jgi:hypothetical protein
MTRRLRIKAEDGYSLAAVMLVLLATSIMAGAALAAVGTDIPFARASQDRKEAYAAAEAGIEYYLYQLTRDNDYWRLCDTAPGPDGQPNPVNQPKPSATSRRWRTVAGTTDARFSIELLPANKTTSNPDGKCNTATAQAPTAPDLSMIDQNTGTFRIRSTGESRGERRSIVTTFRRNSFLDFIYFTDYEALDPLTLTNTDDQATARNLCVKYRAERSSWCGQSGHNMNITFPDWDNINGPLHTNDNLLTSGSPDFGRGKYDAIEVVGTPPSTGGSPNFKGEVRNPAEHMPIPPSNDKLKENALAGYLYYGSTTIRLQSDGKMDVTTHTSTGANVSYSDLPYPSNGVVFVEKTPNKSCSIASPVRITYPAGADCAVLTVKGSYNKSLTLGSRDDILIDGNITQTPNSDSVLGLIAQRFVRVKHQVTSDCNSNSGTDGIDYFKNLQIDAAILALNDSFIVDNWQCGNPLQVLTVNGAIAQKFRGPVGTFNGDGSRNSGYAKNYNYDDRLRYRSPPYFVEPVKASWKVVRQNEQVPAVEDK